MQILKSRFSNRTTKLQTRFASDSRVPIEEQTTKLNDWLRRLRSCREAATFPAHTPTDTPPTSHFTSEEITRHPGMIRRLQQRCEQLGSVEKTATGWWNAIVSSVGIAIHSVWNAPLASKHHKLSVLRSMLGNIAALDQEWGVKHFLVKATLSRQYPAKGQRLQIIIFYTKYNIFQCF